MFQAFPVGDARNNHKYLGSRLSYLVRMTKVSTVRALIWHRKCGSCMIKPVISDGPYYPGTSVDYKKMTRDLALDCADLAYTCDRISATENK